MRNKDPLNDLEKTFLPPNWRYAILVNPAQHNIFNVKSKNKPRNGLNRYIDTRGIKVTVETQGNTLQKIFSRLGYEEKTQLQKFIKRDLTYDVPKDMFTWSQKQVEQIKDIPLKRLLKHCASLEQDPDIQFQLQFSCKEEYMQLFTHFGYFVYQGYTDIELQKEWKFTLKRVKLIRDFFYDFSHLPKNKTTRLQYLRQMLYGGFIDKAEFNVYKRIDDLGKQGLESISGVSSMSSEEKNKISDYLQQAVLENTLNLKFQIESSQDARSYNTMVQQVIPKRSNELEEELARQRIENVRANTKRVLNETTEAKVGFSDIDYENLDLLRQLQEQEPEPMSYKTVLDIKKQVDA